LNKPLPWGILFFSFWIALQLAGNLTPLMEGMAWFFLVLSAILLCSIFIIPLNRFLTKPKVSGFFEPIVFFVTLFAFTLTLISSWTNLEGLPHTISVYGGILWVIAYLLVLIAIVVQMRRVGRFMGLAVGLFLIGDGIYQIVSSDVLAGVVLLTLGILSIVIVFTKPQFGQRWPI